MKGMTRMTQGLTLAALCWAGAATAQSGPASTQPTSPSNTPNDTTGVQPNSAQQPGTQAPAPTQSTTPMPDASQRPSTGQSGPHTDGKGKAPSDAGNTNVSPTDNMQGSGSAPYTPKQK